MPWSALWQIAGMSIGALLVTGPPAVRSYVTAARPLFPHNRPPRRSRSHPLPRAGRLARIMAGAEWPPLPEVEACEGHRPSPDEGSDPTA
jgi:hypothetical protein